MRSSTGLVEVLVPLACERSVLLVRGSTDSMAVAVPVLVVVAIGVCHRRVAPVTIILEALPR